ncbi:MAG: vWA domain-containing protein [Candidatus Thorarchaeota archaeon]|jgi:Mg-chelatase subunit ChlD
MSEKLGQLDLVFVVDNTGSMGSYIDVTKRKILEIIRTIKKEELCHRLRVGLVSYRDHPPEDNTFVTQKYELTPDTGRIEQNVMQMSADGGGDGPEAVDDAMDAANRMEFLLDAAKVVVLVADAPPHGVEEGDRWPKGPPSGINWDVEAKKAYDKGIVYHTVGCFPEINNYQHGVRVFQEIAETTQGKFFPLNEAELLVKIITGVAIEEIDKIAIQKSILKEMGVSMEEFPADEELTEDRIKELAAKVRSTGMIKRAMKHVPSAAGAEEVEGLILEPEEISEADIREAVRQLKKKSDK